MKILETLGATSRIWQVFIADSSSTTGAGLTGLAFNTASLTAYYHRDTDTTATAITLVTMTVGTFTSSGFKEIDATNMPGWYQLCPPNAALASGAKSVALLLKGATNMAPLPIEVQLTAVDFTDAVRGGMTALPNATAGASGGLHINGSNAGTTTYAAMTVTGSLTISDGLLVSRSTSNSSAITATGNGTGSGIVATSGAGATGDGIQATAGSTNGNGLKLTKTGSGNDLAATSTTLTLAKTTNITGFNDIAATAIVSSGAITTSSGAVSTVTTVATTTNLTNAPTNGDLTAAMKTSVENAAWDATLASHLTSGSTGAALNAAGAAGDPWSTAIPGAYGAGTAGNIVGNNLNATITSRMASYTQPTGFLAATFPTGTVASTTNITAGTITTTTNVTNGVTLAVNAVDSTAVATSGAQEIAAAVGAISLGASNNNYTLIQGQTILLSAVAAKVSGENTGAPAFRDLADTKDVITGTDDGSGNRLTITYNP